MKTKQAIIIAGLAAVVAAAIAVVWLSKNQIAPAKSAGGESAVIAPAHVPDAPEISPPEPATIAVASPLPEKSAKQSNNPKPAGTAPAEPPIIINGYELQDPLARVALNFVGADPEADAYWMGAINDSAMPAEERKDLIEDLNEDGLSDPRHPAVQDLPLIMARIRLIEQLAPRAMDDVNRDAFAEAYKDLVGLLNGQPPQ